MRRMSQDGQSVLIEKHAIRLYYYLGSLTAVVLLAVILTVMFTRSMHEEFDNKISQLSKGLIAEKKRFIRNAVDRTIFFIEEERTLMHRELAGTGLSDQEIEEQAVAGIKDYIRKLRLVDDGYVWVNRIVNYLGGDNYAVREIHPNLPQTEGMWLSTATTDIKGNLPYAAELEGMKEHGEVYFEYFFKKMDSEKIIRKMAYAKLYKPYDWVVATGVYLDDVDNLVEVERAKMDATYKAKRTLALSVAAGIVLLSTLLIVFFEKQVARLISTNEQNVCRYTKLLKEISCTDHLTGLFNRVRLDEVFRYESRQFNRYKTAFSIILMDVDHFKRINDTCGHQVGDLVLTELAGLLRVNSRDTDTVGRWGGEEFLFICSETGLENTVLMADKIRGIIEAHDFPEVRRITCSFGVSTFHEGDDIKAMLDRADKSLYRAKAAGRNKVVSERYV